MYTRWHTNLVSQFFWKIRSEGFLKWMVLSVPRIISFRSGPTSGQHLMVKHMDQSTDSHPSPAVTDRRWFEHGGTYQEVNLDKLQGRNLASKIDMLMAYLSARWRAAFCDQRLNLTVWRRGWWQSRGFTGHAVWLLLFPAEILVISWQCLFSRVFLQGLEKDCLAAGSIRLLLGLFVVWQEKTSVSDHTAEYFFSQQASCGKSLKCSRNPPPPESYTWTSAGPVRAFASVTTLNCTMMW